MKQRMQNADQPVAGATVKLAVIRAAVRQLNVPATRLRMVDGAGIEPATFPMSRGHSTAELTVHNARTPRKHPKVSRNPLYHSRRTGKLVTVSPLTLRQPPGFPLLAERVVYRLGPRFARAVGGPVTKVEAGAKVFKIRYVSAPPPRIFWTLRPALLARMQHPTSTFQTAPPASPAERREPTGPMAPLVLASPHSGAYYPDDFVAASPLEIAALRKSEDCYVDELFGDGPDLGAPLLRALYPRAYVDLNREPYELDPEMFEQPLPSFVNTTSARVASGLGTIARIVGNRREIYRGKLSFAEAERRITGVHKPYHQSLRSLIARAQRALRILHPAGLPLDAVVGLTHGPGRRRRSGGQSLGDRNGRSCQPSLSDAVSRQLVATGYNVVRNMPYAGGYTTQHYGNPGDGIHVLQIEINRALYMDENTLQRSAGFAQLRDNLRLLIGCVIAYGADRAQDLRYQRLSAE